MLHKTRSGGCCDFGWGLACPAFRTSPREEYFSPRFIIKYSSLNTQCHCWIFLHFNHLNMHAFYFALLLASCYIPETSHLTRFDRQTANARSSFRRPTTLSRFEGFTDIHQLCILRIREAHVEQWFENLKFVVSCQGSASPGWWFYTIFFLLLYTLIWIYLPAIFIHAALSTNFLNLLVFERFCSSRTSCPRTVEAAITSFILFNVCPSVIAFYPIVLPCKLRYLRYS